MEKNGLVGKCGIIYTPFANQCTSLAAAVQDRLGIQCAAFYGSVSRVEKKKMLAGFLNDEIKVIVATSAFGAGVDKPNVRFVYHVTMSSSLLEYVQESGRAGRDGEASDCCLFYNEEDVDRLVQLRMMHSGIHGPSKQKQLEAMKAYVVESCRYISYMCI
jgi:superfamily II DNA helicase RecQ